jgi:hypothetical protein
MTSPERRYRDVTRQTPRISVAVWIPGHPEGTGRGRAPESQFPDAVRNISAERERGT